ncbi:EAL domain-containing protein [Undibacterium cyanobacteriorum]|uniref:EAL domain-containing protein n=1 Tax=Undibacterium cyanobacteriorum TaxID=3073561 RepID=A0ABY9RG07_9BURK|nr:EAL domain-containing protein [Undibacterium sp. 20NA77.5]WMW80167.1 EAL domain-containing protein [Undibacterium sp. 20NA77.5]
MNRDFITDLAPTPDYQSMDLQAWRNELLSSILFWAVVLGVITAIPSIVMAIRDDMISVAVIDVVAITWAITIWYMKRLSWIARSWNLLLIIYLIGLFFFFKIGPVSQIYLMAVPVLAALLLGLRPAVYALVINAATLLGLGYVFNVNLQFDRFPDQPFVRWVIITLNFTFISAVITVSCGVLLRRLEASFRSQLQISESLRREQASLKKANEELRLISAAVENLNDIVMITDSELDNDGPHIVFVNKAFERTTGYSLQETKGMNPRMLQGDASQADDLVRIREAILAQKSVRAEFINYRKSGEEFWLEADIQPIVDEQGHCTHFVAVERDITDRKRAESDIYRLAFFDVLTGLPNRRLLRDRLSILLATAQRTGIYSAVLFIDLDHFKNINDARGHATGDALLVEVARRLTSILREVDTVARIGGDEFVVLIDHLDSVLEQASRIALTVAEKIRNALATPFEIEGQIYSSACSIGVTLLPKASQTVDDLLRESDTAMYRAKGAGRNQIAFFEGAMQAEVEQRLILERDLSRALDLCELRMVMQAQVDQDGTPVGAELLMRWTKTNGEFVSPALFIPLAEETGLILKLGDWVLHQACEIVNQLRSHGWMFPVSVNVSPKQFRQQDFVEKVRDILSAHHLSGKEFVFEVTEGLFISDMQETIARMNALAALGIRFSIDDFGTGYSSLFYLKRLPLYELKIDKSFVQDVPGDANDVAIVRMILSMAKHLGLRVVAEGVETKEQATYLIENSCDCMQGFLFSKPASFQDWLGKQGPAC